MAPPTRRSRPRPWRFIVVGGLLGFVVLGIVSMNRPNENTGFDVSYDPSVALGFLSLFGLFGGALLGAIVAALLAERAERSLRREARAQEAQQAQATAPRASPPPRPAPPQQPPAAEQQRSDEA